MLRTLALSAALCAALTPVGAQAALRLSTDGAGSAVYVPYYSVEDGQTSLVTVSNHGSEPVAARVTFTESQNGQEVLYFLVFLPPLSSWSSAVAASGDGAAASWSAEGVCTVPAAPGEVPFRNFAYADIFPDAGSSGLERTRTGAIEVLEIGTLSGALAEATLAGECATLIAAYSDNPPFDRAPLFGAPAESLSASAQLVEVESGIIHAVPGIAVKGFSDRSLDPAAGGFEIGLRFSRPVLPEGASEFLVETSAGGLAFPADRGADAISSLFMAESLRAG